MKVHESIQKLVPYRPGRPISAVKKELGLTHVIKLASNENPLGPSPKAVAAVEAALKELNFYPDPGAQNLVSKLSHVLQVPTEQIVLGNGSDELFDQLIRIYCDPGQSILISKGAFSAYPISAGAARVKVIETDLAAGYQIDLEAFSKVLREQKKSSQIRLVFIPNINNPTGLYLNKQTLCQFLDEWGQDPELYIVMDEAYHEFVRAKDYVSAMELRKAYPNVLVSRTFSKVYGLAGLRVGFLVGPSEVVDHINRIRKPFNVNHLAQVAAVAALEDQDFLKKTCELTWTELDRVTQALDKLGVEYLPSQGNFVMLNMARDVKTIENYFLQKGVIIRPVDNYGFKTWIRLSIGLPDENTTALKVLESALKDVAP